MTPDQALTTIAQEIIRFDQECEEAEYTDPTAPTGKVWELLERWKGLARDALQELPDAHRFRMLVPEVEWCTAHHDIKPLGETVCDAWPSEEGDCELHQLFYELPVGGSADPALAGEEPPAAGEDVDPA